MNFVIYALGILTGMSVLLAIILITIRNKTTINRKVDQITSKLAKKGKLIEPTSDELENWIDNLPKQ